jgi:hypothetical protein
MVQDAFDDWAARYGLCQLMETLTRRLDTLAFDAGLSSRTALFVPEPSRDSSTQEAVHQALETFWSGVTGNGVELCQDAHRLTEKLVTALRLSAGCIPWLALELLSCFFDSIRAHIEDRAVTRAYTEKPFPEVVTVRIDPRLSTRQRSRALRHQVLAAAREQSTGAKRKKLPKGGGRYILTYVKWLVQNGLHGVRVSRLARALLASEPGLRSSNYDARHRVQYGIMQARIWLAAVEHTPSSRLARPKHPTTRERSTSGCRRRSRPR